MTEPRIITEYVHPPIPLRQYDWCAYRAGTEEEGPYGCGRTEAAAIADLMDAEDDAMTAMIQPTAEMLKAAADILYSESGDYADDGRRGARALAQKMLDAALEVAATSHRTVAEARKAMGPWHAAGGGWRIAEDDLPAFLAALAKANGWGVMS